MSAQPSSEPIYVTQPYLPPLAELMPAMEDIWRRKVLTNGGHYHQLFERAVAEFLGVEHLSLVTNGTVALSLALEALNIEGEVITTPFSFVATSHALRLKGVRPVFVDVEYGGANIDPARIEEAVTDATSAIMPVHCYGVPCDVAAIQDIADANNLAIIYDAAHTFGVKDGEHALSRGDISTLSFHATKAFNTFEGGAVISRTAELKHAVDRLRNFGFRDETCVDALGTNGKMSEFSAALGLLQLDHFETVRSRRRAVDAAYREGLANVRGITCLSYDGVANPNFSYFPIFVGPEHGRTRDQVFAALREQNIFARRYFYPLISQFGMYRAMPSARPKNLPNATRMANEVLCLPIYPDLGRADQERIISIVRDR